MHTFRVLATATALALVQLSKHTQPGCCGTADPAACSRASATGQPGYGCNHDSTALYVAAQKGQEAVARLLLQAGAAVDKARGSRSKHCRKCGGKF